MLGWEDNIEMDLREIGWNGMNCFHLGQDREQWKVLVNTVMNLPVLYNIVNVLNNFTICGFSRRTQLHGV
jgi:hypothetical protein